MKEIHSYIMIKKKKIPQVFTPKVYLRPNITKHPDKLFQNRNKITKNITKYLNNKNKYKTKKT